MEARDLAENPFSALLAKQPSPVTVKSTQDQASDSPDATEAEISKAEAEPEAASVEQLEVSSIIEQIFLITLNPDVDKEPSILRPARCVFLEEVYLSLSQRLLDLDCLEQAVFERLMLTSPGDYVVKTSSGRPSPSAAAEASEAKLLQYLYRSYCRAKTASPKQEAVINKCVSVILGNARLYMQHPEVFGEDIRPCDFFIQIFVDEATSADSEMMLDFFDTLVAEINANSDEGSVEDVFTPALTVVKEKFSKDFSLSKGVMFQYTDLLCFFTRTTCMAQVLLKHTQPKQRQNGRSYEDTTLGRVLSIHCLPRNNLDQYEFFLRPSRFTKQEHDMTESSIHQPVSVLNEALYTLVYNLLKLGGDVKQQTLEWLGECMAANIGRAKMWTQHMPLPLIGQMFASDAFLLNLCGVLLRLCRPFSQPCSPKLLKVQPTYCKATSGNQAERRKRNVHCVGLENETTLIPCEAENEAPQLESNYGFVSECFFMTHQCLHLGVHVVNERLLKVNQELHRIQQVFRELQAQGAENSEPGQKVHEQMEKGMTRFFCMKASLTQPDLLHLSMDFLTASATYLIQLATAGHLSSFTPLSFPLPSETPRLLAAVPEFVIENIVDFLLFIRRFKSSQIQTAGDRIEHLMSLVLVFMGSPSRMKNPHLRAHMAEVLEALMPPKEDGPSFLVTRFHQEQLFHQHPHIRHLAVTLLNVFVSIEMTGQGVEFEQKFNYRRPMYSVLGYIWDIELHRNAIKELANEALAHMEDPDPPLFLRFINLLINDAIFLLDEALSYMQQIKEKQEEKESGAWSNLEPQQQQENEMGFRQISMLARFHNLMGNDTINSLEMLTREIKDIFIHKVMVDRVAAMLNYFLLHLVGPKKRNLKVKNFEEYEFRPQQTVSSICQLYLNLGGEDAFCLAVSGDGRSYSPELFVQAQNVLTRIGRSHDMIMQFVEFAAKVKALGSQQQEEEDLMADAPDEFLDPIMGTLMREPVRLPSSGIIIDKATIQRHILSDQSDPFNRSPLTMDMVIPAEELRAKIAAWMEENRKSQKS